jgi:hypothetical protein
MCRSLFIQANSKRSKIKMRRICNSTYTKLSVQWEPSFSTRMYRDDEASSHFASFCERAQKTRKFLYIMLTLK